ncbi:hypothetical protein BTR23_05915 [Alkalihalophilus pseudofirmus]|nr:hypothetical protein BTR23_05915 [Alkalihalophilus pseudofirmus]
MNALIQKRLKNQRGLTLIELLVVIVILGIIAAIAVPMVMGSQDKAYINTNLQNQKVIQDAVNRYLIENPTAKDEDNITLVNADGEIVTSVLTDNGYLTTVENAVKPDGKPAGAWKGTKSPNGIIVELPADAAQEG